MKTLLFLLLGANSMIAAIAAQPVSYQSIRVDGVDISYREAGPKDGPVILLLHGVPSSSRMYEPLLHSELTQRYRLIAPDYPGFGNSAWPNPKEFAYTFDHLAQVIQDFSDQLHLPRYTLFMQDYGGPVGLRMAMAHPEKVQALIVQNANAYQEGLSPLWAVRRAFWQNRAAHEEELRLNFLSVEATKKRHVGTSPDASQYNPDLWIDEFYYLNRPGQAEIQLDLFYDYRTNIEAYPRWQQWLREVQPPLLVLWGKYDSSFLVPGAEAFRRDVPRAEIHILEAGHFAMDLKSDEVVRFTRAFMDGLPGNAR